MYKNYDELPLMLSVVVIPRDRFIEWINKNVSK